VPEGLAEGDEVVGAVDDGVAEPVVPKPVFEVVGLALVEIGSTDAALVPTTEENDEVLNVEIEVAPVTVVEMVTDAAPTEKSALVE